MFAAAFALAVLVYTTVMASIVTWSNPAEYTTHAAAAAETLTIAGLLILLVANLAGRRLNRWPLYLLVISGLLAESTMLALHMIEVLELDWLDTRLDWILPSYFLSFAASCVAWLFALIYALQLAQWLSSRTLAIASSLVLGAASLMALAAVWWLAGGHWRVEGDLIYFSAAAFSSLANTMYFLILAVRLARAPKMV